MLLEYCASTNKSNTSITLAGNVVDVWIGARMKTAPSRDLIGKVQQRWLWHAIDHHTGKVLAYVLASHELSLIHI